MTRDFFGEVVSTGVDYIAVTIYYTKWDREYQLKKFQEFMAKIGLSGCVNAEENSILFETNINKSYVLVRSVNFEVFGQDRGGLIKEGVARVKRVVPCDLPEWQININYLGEIYPCCHVFPRQINSATS